MSISLDRLFLILVFHWIADFIVQTRYQANNKSKSNLALIQHVTSYTLFMSPLVIILETNSLWLVINMILHFCTDYVTSRVNSYLWNRNRVHEFFINIGFDQLIHYFCLFYSLEFFKI